MSRHLFTVFGGTGFLGRNVVRRLVGQDCRVRVAVRNPRAGLFQGLDVEQVRADVRNPSSVVDAVSGARGVVNAVGLYVERGADTFEAVHVEGAACLAEQTYPSGVRLVHISGIGADPRSPSPYVRARAMGERRVREANPDAVILSPSVLFGRNDAFLRTLSTLIRFLPVIPLFGDGGTRLQPVYVKDVATAAACVLRDPEARGHSYQLGGPRIYTYRELLATLAAYMGRKRLFLPVPFALWNIQAGVAAILPNPPLTRDQITLMRHDNVVSPDAAGFRELGVSPRALEELLPSVLPETAST